MKNKKMIKIGKIDKKLIIPILAGILYLPFYIISEKMILQNHFIIFSLCSAMGMILSIIPLLISKYNMKRAMSNKTINKINKKTVEIQLIYNKSSDEIKRYKHFYLFLSSITDFLQSIIAVITFQANIRVNFCLFDIIFISILSYVVLNIKLLKHQIISMTIIVISGLIVDFFIGNLRDLLNNFGYILLRLFCEFSFSFTQIINKYCMDYKFVSPYEVCFFLGIFTFIYYLISLIISSNVSCHLNFCYLEDKNKKKYFDKFSIYIENVDKKESFYFILEMIILSLINILTLLTIKYFTPFHSIIILIIGRINFTIDKFIDGNSKLEDIIHIILFIFILFGLLIYFEIIILNFCGIQTNTKDNIEKRGILDTNMTINDDNNSREDTLTEINEINEESYSSHNSSIF